MSYWGRGGETSLSHTHTHTQTDLPGVTSTASNRSCSRDSSPAVRASKLQDEEKEVVEDVNGNRRHEVKEYNRTTVHVLVMLVMLVIMMKIMTIMTMIMMMLMIMMMIMMMKIMMIVMIVMMIMMMMMMMMMMIVL